MKINFNMMITKAEIYLLMKRKREKTKSIIQRLLQLIKVSASKCNCVVSCQDIVIHSLIRTN